MSKIRSNTSPDEKGIFNNQSVRKTTKQSLKRSTLSEAEQYYVVAHDSCRGDLNKNILQFEKNDILLIKGDYDKNYYWGSINGLSGYVYKIKVKLLD